MNPTARALILIGVLLVVAGLVWQFGGRYLPLGRLPGDVSIHRPGFQIYFPFATCLLVSAAFSLVMWLIRVLKE